jgi:hypothetical protein
MLLNLLVAAGIIAAVLYGAWFIEKNWEPLDTEHGVKGYALSLWENLWR